MATPGGIQDKQSLRHSVVGAIRWSAVERISVQLITWALTLWVVRLLSPADYGLMAMATVCTTFLSLINELGLASAIVQRHELTHNLLRQAVGYVFLVNSVCFVGLSAAAPLIARFFGEDRLALIVCVLAFDFVIQAPGVVPLALLVRGLEFRRKSVVEVAARILSGVLTLGLALAGEGVWALVWGSLLGSVVRSVGFIVVSGFKPSPSFSLSELSEVVAFGGTVMMQRILWFAYTQADIFLIGRLLGGEALGFYSVAVHLGSLPMQKLNAIINQLTLPTFSRLRSQDASVAFYAHKAIRFLSLFAFPVFFGISAVAPEITAGILGEKWLPALVPLALMSLIMPLRMVGAPISEILNAIGKPGVVLGNVVLTMVVIVPAILIGTMWDVTGVCLAWILVYPPIFLVTLGQASRSIGMRLRDALSAMWRPAACAGLMYLSVAAARVFLLSGLGPLYRLLFLSSIGLVVFTVPFLFIDRKTLSDIGKFVRT